LVNAQPRQDFVNDLNHEPADQIADPEDDCCAENIRNRFQYHPQHVACRPGYGFELQCFQRQNRHRNDDQDIGNRADCLADRRIASDRIDAAAIRPFVQIDGLQECHDKVANDPCHDDADEEYDRCTEEIGNEAHDRVEQGLDRSIDSAKSQNAQYDEQAKQPDQQGDNLAERLSDRRAR